MTSIVSGIKSNLKSLRTSVNNRKKNDFISHDNASIQFKNKFTNRNVVVTQDNKPVLNKTLRYDDAVLGRTNHKGELEFYDAVKDMYHKAKFMDKHGHGTDRDKGDIGIKASHNKRFGSSWFRKQQYISLGEQPIIKMALEPEHLDNSVRNEALNEFKQRYDHLLGENSSETRSDYAKLNTTTLSPKALINTKKAGAAAMMATAVGGVTGITIAMHGMPLVVAGVGLGISALAGILSARFAGAHYWRK